MNKIGVLLLFSGIIGLISLYLYTGMNLSRVFPFLTFINVLIYLTLGGIVSILGNFCDSFKIKLISFSFLILAFLISFLPFLLNISVEIKIQILFVILSYTLMISSLFNSMTLKTLIVLFNIFPVLNLFFLKNQIITFSGTIYLISLLIIGIYNLSLSIHKKRA